MTHNSHNNFAEALSEILARRHYIFSWEPVGEDWGYNVRFNGETANILLQEKYEMSVFEMRDVIKEEFRRAGIKLTGTKATR